LTAAQGLLKEKRAFQRSLLRWYALHQRDLPWRKNPDPYRILVSEFMLQQTRVETVIPYFERFLKLFPTLADLARAPLPKVLKAWAGLGYYARARHLHSAVRTISRDYGGMIPKTQQALLGLPGFGAYTAGAVASLAFHEPVVAMDGNGRRVFARLLELRESDAVFPRTKLTEFIEALIPPKRSSAFNQALMDLGAMICIPAQPRCLKCPVKEFCTWQGGEDPSRVSKKVRVRNEIWAIALIENQGRFLLLKKEGQGLLAGLWHFPYTLVEENMERNGKEKILLARTIQEKYGFGVKIAKRFPPREYIFTHIHAVMKPYLCSLRKEGPRPSVQTGRWAKPSAFSRYPISTAMKRIASLVTSLS
jgi:A/G-specific adenine glycosylase